jgi:hypothetical protein
MVCPWVTNVGKRAAFFQNLAVRRDAYGRYNSLSSRKHPKNIAYVKKTDLRHRKPLQIASFNLSQCCAPILALALGYSVGTYERMVRWCRAHLAIDLVIHRPV